MGGLPYWACLMSRCKWHSASWILISNQPGRAIHTIVSLIFIFHLLALKCTSNPTFIEIKGLLELSSLFSHTVSLFIVPLGTPEPEMFKSYKQLLIGCATL